MWTENLNKYKSYVNASEKI